MSAAAQSPSAVAGGLGSALLDDDSIETERLTSFADDDEYGDVEYADGLPLDVVQPVAFSDLAPAAASCGHVQVDGLQQKSSGTSNVRVSAAAAAVSLVTGLLAFAVIALLVLVSVNQQSSANQLASALPSVVADSACGDRPHSTAATGTSPAANTPFTAYILSTRDERYNWSMANLQRGFPGLFSFQRITPVSRLDARVVNGSSIGTIIRSQKVTIFDTWEEFARGAATRCLPDDSWMFFFEDDVNVWGGLGEHFDFGPELLRLLASDAVRHDGMVYLGKCGGPVNASTAFRHTAAPAPGLASMPGYGACNHALGFAKWRAARMAADIAVHVPQQHDHMDQTIIQFVQGAFEHAQQHWPMVFGGDVAPSDFKDHHGVVFQDRARWPPTVNWEQK